MRRGVTIVEVLFSILVVSIGLLGSIAVFVVASTQMKKAIVNDVSGASGRSAVHDFDTRGMRQPRMWVGWPIPWNVPQNGPQPIARNEFVLSMPNVPLGVSYCIDPRFLAMNQANQQAASFFPYPAKINNLDPRMYRISLHHGKPINDAQGNRVVDPAMTLLHANLIFTFGDDLAFVRPGLDDTSQIGIPNDRALPAIQDANRSPNQRQTHGRFSWFATLVPKAEIYSGRVSDEYILSVVVFHERAIYPGCVTDPILEQVFDGVFQDDGSTGGEIQLAPRPNTQAEPLKLRSGNWVMVSANQVFGNASLPRFQWYRVTNSDEDRVTLMGPDWNTSYVNPRFPTLAGGCEVTIVPGVVAVYEKTIRLDAGRTF